MNQYKPVLQKLYQELKKKELPPFEVILPNMEVSSSELAKVLNVNNTTIYLYIREGMPQIAKNKFSLFDCLQWYHATLRNRLTAAQENYTYEQERTRKIKSEADLKQIELDLLTGKLIPMETATYELSRVMTIVKSTIVSIPNKLAPQIVGRPLKEVKLILQSELNESVRAIDFSKYYEVQGTGDRSGQPRKAARKTKAK